MVFAWLERSRAQAFRVTPVRPPADPTDAEILAELRQLSYLIRNAELDGARDPAAISRRTPLQRDLKSNWQAGGLGKATAQASLGEVSARLEESGKSLVGILACDDRMQAVVLRRRTVHLAGLGDSERAQRRPGG